ncbi:mitochondrial carrier protein-like protein [Westerdykella ornata]|uniref:Mitochondrial carrier protein-like protein n=1 Tax=Westerdykella ornata TaxID=318751 RepID=A0A6A6J4U9_WESOR|nr:mitochondrial carrier protein-like protein [Westerdykella ornata]KAF2271422.1 mitochondrial carrier protein-like protein [Westerdykella ornata]
MTASSSTRPAGVAPKDDVDGSSQPNKGNASTGVQAASIRAITARAVAFYFRAPVKAFFRGRIDYLGYARAINPHLQRAEGWSWRVTTPALLAHAVKTEGWSFIPNQVLPPLLANTFIGAVLYTGYLQTLNVLHEPTAQQTKRVYPPPPVTVTFTAGLIGGAIQSLLAAPFDALQVRFRTADILHGHYKTMWHYSAHKLRSIGLRGIFAGWTLSLLKDSLGSALFFGTFETVKSQAYYAFITKYYSSRTRDALLGSKSLISAPALDESDTRPVIKPHYAIEPAFLLLAGMSASITSQLIQHPLTELQDIHYRRLEALDYQDAHQSASRPSRIMQRYYHAYEETFRQCKKLAKRQGGWRRYLYRDFWMSTIRQVPSTSAGLIVFELVRRKYAFESEEEMMIEREGVRILLT